MPPRQIFRVCLRSESVKVQTVHTPTQMLKNVKFLLKVKLILKVFTLAVQSPGSRQKAKKNFKLFIRFYFESLIKISLAIR